MLDEELIPDGSSWAVTLGALTRQSPHSSYGHSGEVPAYTEEQTSVSRWSAIQIDRRLYSVPSRLIGETVRVRRFEEHLEVHLGGVLQVRMPRLTGAQTHAINYRHVIEWLVRKPGAFAQYRFREDLFPSLVFRRAYDRLCAACSPRTADVEYLRILRQAARTMESTVEAVLLDLEQRGVVPRWSALMEFWPAPPEKRFLISSLRAMRKRTGSARARCAHPGRCEGSRRRVLSLDPYSTNRNVSCALAPHPSGPASGDSA